MITEQPIRSCVLRGCGSFRRPIFGPPFMTNVDGALLSRERWPFLAGALEEEGLDLGLSFGIVLEVPFFLHTGAARASIEKGERAEMTSLFSRVTRSLLLDC